MKYRLIIPFFLTLFLLYGCKCDSYFSSTKIKGLSGYLFDVECHITPSVISGETSRLEVSLDFNDKPEVKAIRKSFKIYPILTNTDTLMLITNYSSIYSFSLPENNIKNINLFIQFDADSLGVIVHKKVAFNDLKRIEFCRFYPLLH
jgi:hypothetical protein